MGTGRAASVCGAPRGPEGGRGGAEAVAERYRYPSALPRGWARHRDTRDRAAHRDGDTRDRAARRDGDTRGRALPRDEDTRDNTDSGCKKGMNTMSHHFDVNQGHFRACYLPVDGNLL